MGGMSSMNGQIESPEWLLAYAVLKRPSGSSLRDEPLTARNIKAHLASPEVIEQVRHRLEDLGFTVTRVSPLSITVEGSAEQFESVFHGRLRKLPHPQIPSGFWTWFEPPEIPDDLKDKVDTIVLPEPVKLVV
jgi:hypothetical protein